MIEFRTIVILSLLAAMFCLVYTFADDKKPDTAKGALTTKQIKVIRCQMDQHRNRAFGLARMAYFNEALRELDVVETLFQSINGRISESSHKGPATYYKLNNEQTHQLILAISIRAETYRQTLARFRLPEGTLSDFKVIPVPLPANKICWAVIYTVRSPDLTKRQIMLNPAFYQMIERDISRTTLESFFLSIASLRETDLQPQLGQINIPTMGMYGDKDVIVHPKQWQPLQAGIPQARIERFKSAGHFIMLDEPDQFAATLKDFLDDDSPKR